MPHHAVILLAVLTAHLSLLHAADKHHLDATSLQTLTKSRVGTLQPVSSPQNGQKKRESESRSRSEDVSARAAKLHTQELAMANAHFLQIRTQYSCQRPRPRLVYMKDLFFSLEKTYMPRCTVIHKCDDESGCCTHEGHECAPKRQQAVQLFFFATFRNMTRIIETVTLSNHTECECRPVNHHPRSHSPTADLENLIKDVLGSDHSEVLATVMPPSTRSDLVVTSSSPVPGTLTPGSDESLQWIDDRLKPKVEMKKGDESLCSHMKCPTPFRASHVTSYPLRCECDCVDVAESRCARIRRGLQRLSGHGATCVRRGHCQEPSCEYGGAFDKMKGTCPQKSDSGSPRHPLKKQYGYERD